MNSNLLNSLLTCALALTAGQTACAQTTYADTDHSTKLNTSTAQARIIVEGNEMRYYNTEDLGAINIDNESGTVTVSSKTGNWKDSYSQSVRDITFAHPTEPHADGIINNNGITLTEAKGWLEACYAKWKALPDAESYHVYVKGGEYADFTPVDSELVRPCAEGFRVDVVGLKAAADYCLKVVPVINGNEDAEQASEASQIPVAPHDRSGFAHHNNKDVGAYTDEGILKSNARVLYVSGATAKTVSLDVVTSSKGTTTTFTGLQAIINGYQKGYETRPLNVRILGTIKDSDMDYFGSSAEGLQVKGKNNTIPMNITIEGIGEDAGIWGFGILMRNAVSVELRNFAVMLCMDDCISIDTDNKYCWLHHIDLFYGKTGGDKDQAKGDGTIDIKGDSQYITIAYNHYFDSGKSSLCGMKSESGPNFISYHHNWFDHSDSRHPRVRTMTVHVWNNYFDGCSKYGIGSTTGSSIFSENNFFRATKNPMLSSKQGTDAKGEGTFSGENGGLIKSYGNVYAEKGTSSNYTPITHTDHPTSFDCYEVTTRNEQVPQTVVSVSGGTSYNNFDTDANLIYSYTLLKAVDVPAYVTGWYGAGRLNKGSFKWTFDNAKEDTNYDVIPELKTALENYPDAVD